jgi:hypothetical protein
MSYAAPSYDSKIDIGASVRAAYATVFDNARLAVELAWLPLAILLGIEILAFLLGGGGLLGRALGGLIHAVGFIVFSTVFAVRWHRFVLIGENIAVGLFPPGFAGFVVAAIKIGVAVAVGYIVLAVIAVLPPHILTVPLAVIGGIALALASVRVSLIFPAAAVERPISLRQAWHLMTGNYWRLFACVLLCALPFGIVNYLAEQIGGTLPWVLWFVFEAIGMAVMFAGLAVVASLLSDLYRGLEPAAPQQRAA